MSNTPSSTVSVGTSATQLTTTDPRRKVVYLTNDGSVTVYVGDANVTTTAYLFKIAAGEEVQVTPGIYEDPLPAYPLFGRVASGTASVSVGQVLGYPRTYVN